MLDNGKVLTFSVFAGQNTKSFNRSNRMKLYLNKVILGVMGVGLWVSSQVVAGEEKVPTSYDECWEMRKEEYGCMKVRMMKYLYETEEVDMDFVRAIRPIWFWMDIEEDEFVQFGKGMYGEDYKKNWDWLDREVCQPVTKMELMEYARRMVEIRRELDRFASELH